MKQLLIIDQDVESCDSLIAIFANLYSISIANNTKEAVHQLCIQKIDAVLLDVTSPIKNCLKLLKELQKDHPSVPIIIMSATTSVKPVINSIQNGAYDFITKPYIKEEVLCTLQQAIKRDVAQQRSNLLHQVLSKQYSIINMAGKSPSFIKVMTKARKAALNESTILIYGERGTGKELTARFIHNNSRRKEGAFVTAQGLLWPISKMNDELFGHKSNELQKHQRKKLSLLDLADSGTLFFNEITKLSLSAQKKLSHILLEKKYQHSLNHSRINTTARIISSSVKDLVNEVKHKHFLEDLLQSINFTTIHLPSLRERREDIPLLCHYFMSYYCETIHVEPKHIHPDTFELLYHYPWPGNIRELRNVIERIMVLYPNSIDIQPDCLPKEFQNYQTTPVNQRSSPKLSEAMNSYEHQLILDALRESKGIQTKAAKLLGTTRRILSYRMKKFKIPSPRSFS